MMSIQRYSAAPTEHNPAWPSLPTSFASISLHNGNLVRLLQFPTEDVAAIRNVIKQNWNRGIEHEKRVGWRYEFQLCGKPWRGAGSDASTSRIIVRELLAHLFSTGWILVTCTDVCTGPYERDTLIFQKTVGRPPPTSPTSWFAISFNERYVLRLIGAPDGLIRAFQDLLNNMQVCEYSGWTNRENNVFEFRLSGTPWKPTGKETMSTRLLILSMLETLKRFGCSLYASTDQNKEELMDKGSDCWYCFIVPSASASRADPTVRPSFASVSFHRTNCIRLLQFPPEDVASIRRNWFSGLPGKLDYGGSIEFTCFGSPWKGKEEDAILSRIMVRELFAHLFSLGWTLKTSTKICIGLHAKDTMIFSKHAARPLPSIWFAISFNQSDRLRLIGAPEYLIQAFRQLLKSLQLLEKEFWKEREYNAYEFKLHGRPFRDETESSGRLMMAMLDTLETLGWRLYASILHKDGWRDDENFPQGTGTDSWYCVRAVDSDQHQNRENRDVVMGFPRENRPIVMGYPVQLLNFDTLSLE